MSLNVREKGVELCQACKKGNMCEVEEIIEKTNGNSSVLNYYFRETHYLITKTPLTIALEKGHFEIVEYLLGLENICLNRPLVIVCICYPKNKKKYMYFLREILKHDTSVDVNLPKTYSDLNETFNGYYKTVYRHDTAFSYCCRNGHRELIEELLYHPRLQRRKCRARQKARSGEIRDFISDFHLNHKQYERGLHRYHSWKENRIRGLRFQTDSETEEKDREERRVYTISYLETSSSSFFWLNFSRRNVRLKMYMWML